MHAQVRRPMGQEDYGCYEPGETFGGFNAAEPRQEGPSPNARVCGHESGHAGGGHWRLHPVQQLLHGHAPHVGLGHGVLQELEDVVMVLPVGHESREAKGGGCERAGTLQSNVQTRAPSIA